MTAVRWTPDREVAALKRVGRQTRDMPMPDATKAIEQAARGLPHPFRKEFARRAWEVRQHEIEAKRQRLQDAAP